MLLLHFFLETHHSFRFSIYQEINYCKTSLKQNDTGPGNFPPSALGEIIFVCGHC